MPDPVDNFADGDTDLATGVVQTATEQAMGTEIMPGGDDGAPNENNTPPTGSNDDFSVGAATGFYARRNGSAVYQPV